MDNPTPVTPKLVIGIGDLHGHVPALEGILATVQVHYAIFEGEDTVRENVQLVFCGDYIDRGPQSKEVIERIMRLEKKNENVTALLGNHELLALAALDDAKQIEKSPF